MGWDPSVLRKYNTTGHFRLINQLRNELRGNPLIRPKAGETVGAANRSKSLTRALEGRPRGGEYTRQRRSLQTASVAPAAPPATSAIPEVASLTPASQETAEAAQARTFRERLNAIEMR